MVFNSQQQGFNLGNAHGKVVISTNVAEAMQQAQRDVQNGVRGIGNSLQGIGNSMSSIGGAINQWMAPITAVGLAGLRTAGNFQESMNEIAARTGLAGEELEKIRQQALKMGADTTFSAQQASDAFLQMLTAGLSAKDAKDILPSVLDAAQASGSDLGQTADTVTNILSAFRLEAKDSARVVDELARAAGSSPSGMIEIGNSMLEAAGSANNFGIKTNELAAIMAILSKNAIRGTKAGNGLGSMLRNMNRQVPATQEAWKELGVSLYDASGNTRNLDTVMKELSNALDSRTMEDQTRLIQALAGAEGEATFNALRMSDGIVDMQETMKKQQSATDIAAQRMKGFNQTVNSLLGSIQTLMIEGLTPFMEGILTPFLKQIIDVVNGITAWARENPELTKTIASVASGVVVFASALWGAGKIVSLIGILISALASPIGLVAAGVAGLATIMIRNWDKIKVYVQPVLNRLIDGISQIRNAIHFFMADLEHFGLAEAIAGIFGTGATGETQQSSLEGVLVAFGMSRDTAIQVVDFLVGIFTSISNTISGIVETLRPLFEEIGTFLDNLFANVDMEQLFNIGRILLSLTNPIGIVMTALQALGVDLGQVFRDAVAGVTRFFEALNNGGTVFGGLRAVFGDSSFIDGLEQGFNDAITFINTVVLPGLQNLANWFTTDVLPGVIDFINFTVKPAIQSFIDGLKKIWTDVSPFLTFLFNWFMSTGLPLIKDFIEFGIMPAVQAFVDILKGIWEAIKPALTDLYNWFMTTGLPKIKEFIEGPFTTALEGIRDFLVGFWIFVKPHLETFKTKLKEIFDFIRINVLLPVLDVLEDIIDTVGNALNMLGDIGANAGTILSASPEDLAQVDFIGAIASEFGLRDNGGPGLAGNPYLIGTGAQPEVFIPNTNGTFIPNFDQVLAGAGGGGMQVHGDIVVKANSYEEGRAAGRGVMDELMDRWKGRGN